MDLKCALCLNGAPRILDPEFKKSELIDGLSNIKYVIVPSIRKRVYDQNQKKP